MIDYGRYSLANGNLPNRDPKTGIRYGIISINNLNEFALEAFEPMYLAHCPECGTEIPVDDCPEECHVCGYEPADDDEWYDDEPGSIEYHEDGYDLVLDEHNDVWVFKSPHTTTAWSHCSPCAPGAAYLDGGDGVDRGLAYCLGDDWREQ